MYSFQTTLVRGDDEIAVDVEYDYLPGADDTWGYAGGEPGFAAQLVLGKIEVVNQGDEIGVVTAEERKTLEAEAWRAFAREAEERMAV